MANEARLWLGSPTVMEFDAATGAYYLKVKVDGGITNVGITGTVVLGAGEDHIGEVGGRTVMVTGSFTRPAATGTYDANDGVTNIATGTASAIAFAPIARVAGGSFLIASARLVKSHTNTTNATFRLWLYRSLPSNVPLDGAAFLPTWAERSNRFGYIDFDSAIAGSDCACYYGEFPASKVLIPADLLTGQTMYGILQVKGAYAPGANEQYFIELGVLQD